MYVSTQSEVLAQLRCSCYLEFTAAALAPKVCWSGSAQTAVLGTAQTGFSGAPACPGSLKLLPREG